MGKIRAVAIGISTLLAAAAPCLADAGSPAPADAAINLNDPGVQSQAHALARKPPVPPAPGHRIAEDHSGRKQTGKASTYSDEFDGHRMANGKPFHQKGNAVASKTLPLGTVAKVTNLENGRTTEVTVEDHGPYVDGRTVDLPRASAEQLGITKREGIAPVVVAPVAVPQPDGSVKPGAGALPGPATAE